MTKITWTGDLNDDCTAIVDGYMLRAEDMGDWWWWAVYEKEGEGKEVEASQGSKAPVVAMTGKEARRTAESVFRLAKVEAG